MKLNKPQRPSKERHLDVRHCFALLLICTLPVSATTADRKVTFPDSPKSIGPVLLYKEGHADLKFIGPAKGSITVPAGYSLYLIPTPEGMKYFNLISSLKPGDLQRIRVHDVPIDESNLKTIAKMNGLVFLDCSYSDMNDALFAQLTGPQTLQQIDFSRTLVKELNLKSLKALKNLEEMDLSNTGICDAAVNNIVEACPQMQVLNLTGTRITDNSILKLQGLKHLRKLKIKRTAITDKYIDKLLSIKALKKVSMLGGQISKKKVLELRQARPDCKFVRDDSEE